ncbi:hypothetical protein BDV12DRAFT_210721 [Aspergillus spectabilis]
MDAMLDAQYKTERQLIVFLNGLGLPQAFWLPTITQLKERHPTHPPILTYDRYGQGQTTDRDPDDISAEDPTHGHDCRVAISAEKLNVENVENISLIFVANSIGCALARLYAQEYPGTVCALLLLDSVLANSDFVSIFPDPDATNFTPSTLPTGITPDALRTAREGIRRIFHPSVGSKEGLSRRNLAGLLPHADRPALLGPGGKGPLVTVVGHDFETFAQETTTMGQPKELTLGYVNPYWERYNQGLVRITEQGRGKGPIQAPGSGHFVQKDNPAFVVGELVEIFGRL